MIVYTVTAVWRAQRTSNGEVCHRLPVHEIPFLTGTPFPVSHPEGTECKCALVPSRGQRGKVKRPSTEEPLGAGGPHVRWQTGFAANTVEIHPKNAFS